MNTSHFNCLRLNLFRNLSHDFSQHIRIGSDTETKSHRQRRRHVIYWSPTLCRSLELENEKYKNQWEDFKIQIFHPCNLSLKNNKLHNYSESGCSHKRRWLGNWLMYKKEFWRNHSWFIWTKQILSMNCSYKIRGKYIFEILIFPKYPHFWQIQQNLFMQLFHFYTCFL